MLSFGLEKASSVEVVAAYSAPQTVVPAVSATPGWHVIGTFFLPKTVTARLDALIQVSKADLVVRVRLFDLHTLSPVSGFTSSTGSLLPVRALSPVAELTGNRRYQIQAECIGTPADDAFGVVSTASITD